MEIDLDNSYNIDFSDVEKEYIFPLGVPCDTSFENQSDIQFENLFEQDPNNNVPTNEKNNSSVNEADKQLSQKKTSDKSNNNSNHISNDKDIKLYLNLLNESNEKESSLSINQKPINSVNHNTQKGPFNISKKKNWEEKEKIVIKKVSIINIVMII